MTEIPPRPLALVLCDDVYQNSNGKHALVGLFGGITAERFPARHPKMCVYIAITDTRPGSKARIEVVNGSTNEPIAGVEGPIPDGPGPLAVCEMFTEIGNLTFPEPGKYYVRFWGNDTLLLERPIHVHQAARPESGDEPAGG